ncbi:hypothetical protein LQZ18_03810 [Lachnospiraceae bacterium ZAX-1]
MMLHAKVTVPKEKENDICIERLQQKMPSKDTAVCLFCAPFGYGKTTALIQYANRSKKKILWYRLDTLDNRETVFLTNLSVLLKQDTEQKWTAKEWQTGGGQAPFCYLEEMAALLEAFTGYAKKNSKEQYCLILDQFEMIGNQTVFDMVKLMLDYRPEQLQIVLAANRGIPDFLFQNIVGGNCTVLREDDFKWTLEETDDWMCKNFPNSDASRNRIGLLNRIPLRTSIDLPNRIPLRTSIDLPNRMALSKAIWLEMGGWPLGIQYLAEYMCSYRCAPLIKEPEAQSDVILKEPEDQSGGISKGSEAQSDGIFRLLKDRNVEFFDWDKIFESSYLEEILEHEISKRGVDEQLWEFLIRSSVLREFTRESLCAALGKQNQVIPLLLRKALHGGWFLFSKNDVFKYLPFFRAYLKRRCSKDVKKETLLQALDYYKKKTEYEAAIYCGLEGGLYEELTSLMEQQGLAILEEGNKELLWKVVSFLEDYPLEFSLRSVEVFAQCAYCIGQYKKMDYYLNYADSQYGKENKFSAYRSLYRALLQFREDPDKYQKQMNHALFFLKENKIELPWLSEQDKKTLHTYEEAIGEKEKKIEVHVFGSFEVVFPKDGKRMSWRTKKGKELFAYLVQLQGKPVERSHLMQLLWPDEIPDNAVPMIHNSIYNIRKELSAYQMEGLVQYQEKRYSIHTAWVVNDLKRLESICDMVEKKNLMDLAEETDYFRTYPGRYLEDVDAHWAEEKANYYDRIFLEGCCMLADEYKNEGNYEKAILLYTTARQIDGYNEELLQNLMRCLQQTGDFKTMKKQYEGFAALLKKDLGIKPGFALNQYYRAPV